MKQTIFILFFTALSCCWNLIYAQTGYEVVFEPTACQVHVLMHDGLNPPQLRYNFNGNGVRWVDKTQYEMEIFDNESSFGIKEFQLKPPQTIVDVKSAVNLAQLNCMP